MSDKYFAADEAKKTVDHLMAKSVEWFRNIHTNRYLDKILKSWSAYHGVYYENSHAISYGGEQGELVNLAINHYRNLAQHMLVMVTSSRPSFQARAVNTDRRSLVQAKLANGLLDYYMREKRLERHIKKAVEYAIAMGTGYVKMEWNSTKGEIYDYLEPDPDNIKSYDEDGNPLDAEGNVLTSYPIYEGDVEFQSMSVLDVVFDSTKENPELHDWVLCRSFINKYDLAAKYPELKDEILQSKPKDYNQSRRLSISTYDETVDIPVYEFFHKRSESLPDGRYIMYIENGTVLVDSIMPYRTLPVFRIAPSDILGTPYGYTPMFDILPIQDAVNSLYSTIMTNQNAFGVQNILNPRGNDIKVNQLEGGLNFVEYNAQAGKPEALNLTATPGEVFNFLAMLEKAMETISGINSVARGNPEKSLRAGNALALVQSQALQFISGLQQSYIQLLEDTSTGLIKMLQDFAKVPRIAAISGINNLTEMKEFKSDDIKDVSRIVVDVGNALMNSTAGRVEVAQNLLQMGLITSPEKYLMILNTGNLDYLTEGQMDELLQVKGENERLIQGEEVIALAIDKHSLHILEHRDVLADQTLRRDGDLVERTLRHIQEHIDLLRNTDPDLLMLIQQQPLSPIGGSPANQPGPQPIAPTGMPEDISNPAAASVSVGDQLQNLPQPATPPAGFENAPQTPEQLLAQNTRG